MTSFIITLLLQSAIIAFLAASYVLVRELRVNASDQWKHLSEWMRAQETINKEVAEWIRKQESKPL